MLIGLVSDTHIAFQSQVLPPQIKDVFRGVDLILHMGDVWVPHVLDELETVAPVLAARGDDDMDEDFGIDSRMEKRQVLRFGDTTLWAMHIKPRYGLIAPNAQPNSYASVLSSRTYVKEEEPEDLPDIVLFGHSHFAEIENYKGILLVNPGSPTMPSYIPKLGTVGLLNLNGSIPEARLVQLQ